ncbi:MAG: peptidoglycan bridge formation glycyltransferase FemA/FemB family protein [Peptococcaceae bacterium]|nr:peptidoglycan bridge formation glycyltransferase FemA/FemB family protein [Peptococcaceae bacterium]
MEKVHPELQERGHGAHTNADPGAHTNADPASIDHFIRAHPKGHFMQSPQWSACKNEWAGDIVVSTDENGNIKGVLSLLTRKMPLFGLTKMYAPRGPVCDPLDEDTLTDLLTQARQIAKKHRSYSLMIDPDIPIENTAFTALMRRLGCQVNDQIKGFDGVQPHFVFRLNIADRTEEELLKSFEKQTRKNIGRAQRFGVTARIADRSELPAFCDLVAQTGERKTFTTRTLEYFTQMYDLFAPNDMRLYLMEYEGTLLAGALIMCYGDKIWSLYSGTANIHRDKNAAYLMRWETIRWGKERGCRIYDLMGVPGVVSADDPLYGLYSFKKGFAGDLIEFAGEFTLVFRPLSHFLLETAIKAYQKLRKTLQKLSKHLKNTPQ